MSTKARHLRLGGVTMGTEWSVLADPDAAPAPAVLQTALQQAVDRVDMQMSTWTPKSDLMRLNAAPIGEWIAMPAPLMDVLTTGLAVSRATQSAFEMNVGDVVRAWGFGAEPITFGAIRAASGAARARAIDALHLDMARGLAQKSAALSLDLSGIAKGYGVDCLAKVLADFGIGRALCSIDGEVRALGTQADGNPWAVAIEAPDKDARRAQSLVTLVDGAVATSGDYRHFVEIKGQRLSHTIDPRRGAPLVAAPASVSVLADSCMLADAMATALMVMGQVAGLAHAKANGVSALFMVRVGDGISTTVSGTFLG